MAEKEGGCVSPAGGVLEDVESTETESTTSQPETKGSIMTARVGRPAPDFEATAYHNGEFTNVKLSTYKGNWIVLCFYPGDFTFV